MPRFAQIQGERAHWVFDADVLFPHAPYVEILDVTGRQPKVEEGDAYDRPNNAFIPKPIPPPPVFPAVQVVGPVGVADVNLIFFSKVGDAQKPHSHDVQTQTFRVVRGSVETDVAGIKTTHSTAVLPVFVVPPGQVHFSTALADKSVLVSVFT